MTPNHLLKLTLPVAFFGYAALANLALFTSDTVERPDLAGFLTGDVTQEIDTLYRANLPHRDPAVGLIGAARYVLLNEGRDGVVAGRDGWLFTAEEFRPLSAAPAGLGPTVTLIADVRNQLRGMGSELVVLPLPAKLDIARATANAVDQSDRAEKEYHQFLAALQRAGVPTVDTRPALAGQGGMFLQTDTHWTPDGAERVAWALAKSGRVNGAETQFRRVDQTPVTFAGDLVSFVTSDNLAPMVGLQPEKVTPYLAIAPADPAAKLDLFSGGARALALVGTSYSANPNWSFAEALKLALGQDVLNYATQGQGPVAPMRAFLAGLDAAEVPPVVIWEFPVRYLSDPDLMSKSKGGDSA